MDSTIRSINIKDRLVQPVSDEVTVALNKTLGHSKGKHMGAWKNYSFSLTDSVAEWQEIVLLRHIPQIIAQVSSRILVGQDLCRDPQWLRIAVKYTADSVAGAGVIARWPRILQPITHWFIPDCQKVQEHVEAARKLMEPFIRQRRQERQNKKTPKEARDAIDWFYEVVEDEPFDPVTFQLTLATVAIHSTSDLLVKVLHDICSHPQLIDELREEVVNVLGAEEFKRSSINNLKLMDSVLKESQRLKPLALGKFSFRNIKFARSQLIIILVAIQRVVTEDIKLSDGLMIHNGRTIVIPGYGMWDSSVYPNADKFDGHRFLRIREKPEQEHGAQFVTTGPNHLGFGHGKHACPRRFFAAMEAKIALAHLLLNFDLKLAPGTDPKVLDVGFALVPDPTAKIMIRRRQEGVPLDFSRAAPVRMKKSTASNHLCFSMLILNASNDGRLQETSKYLEEVVDV